MVRLLFIISFIALAAAQLTSNCYNFPAEDFSPSNFAGGSNAIPIPKPGERAADFSLTDLHGTRFRLSELLQNSHVVLQFGSYTCPIFQGKVTGSKRLAEEFPQVTFLVVYNIEAHPKTDPSPYRGEAWELQYSDYTQAYTYEQRIVRAKATADLWGGFGRQILLVDDLTSHGPNNPIWCTYGTEPNSGFLIKQDGTIATAQKWFTLGEMREEIIKLLGDNAVSSP